MGSEMCIRDRLLYSPTAIILHEMGARCMRQCACTCAFMSILHWYMDVRTAGVCAKVPWDMLAHLAATIPDACAYQHHMRGASRTRTPYPGCCTPLLNGDQQRISELEMILLSLKILPPPRDRRSLELPNTPTVLNLSLLAGIPLKAFEIV